VKSGDVRWLGMEAVEEKASDVSKDGRYLLSLRNRDAQVTPIAIEIDAGEERPLIDAHGVTYWAEFALGGTAVVIDRSTPTRKGELFVVPVGEGKPHSLTPIDYGTIDPDEFVEPSYIHYASSDGLSIPAILYEPRDTGEGRPPPAVVEIHGGPWGQRWLAFFDIVQYLVSRGFSVLQPNFRGSTGYGRAFTDLNHMDWGGGDLRDVIAGVEYLVREGKADSERIAAFGGSYGGYMTYMALTKAPELWEAGVAWVGITDLPAMYEESTPDFRYILQMMMGNPTENAELWRDRSAIHSAGNLKAKLLMIHGVNDARCPVSQARAFRDRLLELGFKDGVDFEYVELGKVGHGSSDIEERLETYETIVRYLEENV
jgi:dipeptidyl aminopeptidase/acylaminoacyl peptidase